jgi:hypothetical protein
VPRREPNKRKLNDVIIKSLPKQGRPYLVWDTKQHGLAVQVQPSGVKSWKCIYSRNSRPRWYSIGRCDAIGLSDARMLAGKPFNHSSWIDEIREHTTGRRYPLQAHVAPVETASFYAPGHACFIDFTRPGHVMKWLPEQIPGIAA